MKVEISEAVMLLVGPLQRKLEAMTESTRMLWFLGACAVGLIGVGLSVGMGWANWQGVPADVSDLQDSTTVLRTDLQTSTSALRAGLENHVVEVAEPAMRRIRATEARQDSIADGVSRIESKVDRLETLMLRGMCRQMGEPVQECELRFYRGQR